MNDQFHALVKGMAQSVTRRGALKKFGVGLAGTALASLGLANKASAGTSRCVQWSCQAGIASHAVYVCGGGNPTKGCFSGKRIGIVPWQYCTNCC